MLPLSLASQDHYYTTLFEWPLLHRFALAMGPAGFVAVIAGWVTTEVGRQPYTVYGLLRTADTASNVPSPMIALTDEMPAPWRSRTIQMGIDHQALFARIQRWLRQDGLFFVHVFTHSTFGYPFAVDGDDDPAFDPFHRPLGTVRRAGGGTHRLGDRPLHTRSLFAGGDAD